MVDDRSEVVAPGEQTGEKSGLTRLEIRAHKLAEVQEITRHPTKTTSFSGFLDELESTLKRAYSYFRTATEDELSLSYAAEWMLDNYYLVQQTIRLIREELPETYYLQLPKLASGSLKDYPRIYDLASVLVATDSAQIEIDRIRKFILTYQKSNDLTMGEIWALPIMLRIGILSSMAYALVRITGIKSNIQENMLPRLDWGTGISNDDIVANGFNSLRKLSVQDWKDFFENVSRVEFVLRQDPSRVYGRMEFESKDRYRKVVEDLALAAGHREEEVAKQAVDLAYRAASSAKTIFPNGFRVRRGKQGGLAKGSVADWKGLQSPRSVHVGYYLIDSGRADLEEHLDYERPPVERLAGWMMDHNALVFLGGIGLISLFLVAALAVAIWRTGGSVWQLAAGILLSVVPAVSVGASLVNELITRFVKPRVLPKLNFEKGIPASCQTMVVIPALLTSINDGRSLLEQLEQHYLRNPDPELGYALLTDFPDSQNENAPEDEALIAAMKQGIQELNQRYPRSTNNPFFLFHRKRLWNPKESAWMGWERKRGKLHEFNQLLRGKQDTSYTIQIGDLPFLARVRYVITLDADTILPRGSASKLIATIAHPLNRAQFDNEDRKVVAGYTILQPRTEVKPTSANRNRFTRIYSGDTGIDLYTRAVSDVYQDFFGEGIYVGKGIYDVDAFERSLAGYVPENALLSHDLFEGIRGRVGLVSDIVLYEDYPPTFIAYIHRLHRWVRGDWQLLPWLSPRIPKSGGEHISNNIRLIDLWKILDNLRRSLHSPALFLLLIAGWVWLPGSVLFWTLLSLSVMAVPSLVDFISWLFGLMEKHPRSFGSSTLGTNLARWALSVVFLPYEAVFDADAIVTTLYRLWVSRRHLLEWTTAARTNRLIGGMENPGWALKQMSSSTLLAIGLGLLIAWIRPGSLIVASPVLFLWFLSPVVAYWLDLPLLKEPTPLSEVQVNHLRKLARRTWAYFEQFVSPEDHWLPPDHFQESPRGVVAHRTSPTNIGLLLASTIAAYDLGYIGMLELATRVRSTLDALKQLEKYRGHFLNWYDTQSLEPLPPRYVSTVDSGNLAACLMVLQHACSTLPADSVFSWTRWEGFLDTLDVLADIVQNLGGEEVAEAANPLLDRIKEIRDQVAGVKNEPGDWMPLLTNLNGEAWQELNQGLLSLVESFANRLDQAALHGLRVYTQRFRAHLASFQRDIRTLIPWEERLQNPPAFFGNGPSIRSDWQTLIDALPYTVRLEDVVATCDTGQRQLEYIREKLEARLPSAKDPNLQEALDWCAAFEEELQSARMNAEVLLIGIQEIIRESDQQINQMDFGFLYDPKRMVFHIGYNVDADRLDNSYYDLLESEARIASLIAIARRNVPQSHWLHLNRPLTMAEGRRVLLSWSGTMFEYLMPTMFMRSYEGTLLHQSNLTAVDRQIAYGTEKKVPWGVSESGFYSFDSSMNYQYRAFGVPDLGFKRGIGEDLVITPYASVMALSYRPQALLENIDRLKELDMLGLYGLYEAIDFTPDHLSVGQDHAIVQSFMVHHQGMIFLSLDNYLNDEIMVRRFHEDPFIQSVDLLLQELIPSAAPLENPHPEEGLVVRPESPKVASVSWDVPAETPFPYTHVLSNGRFNSILTNSGAGYSQLGELNLTRWRADPTLEPYGLWIYLQDIDSGELWSAGTQPLGVFGESQEVRYYPHKAEYRKRASGISQLLEITIPPRFDLEVRRLTITNQGESPRRLRVCSYAEVVLAPHDLERRHPAFNDLFVESEYLSDQNALLFKRRPRSAEEKQLHLIHLLLPKFEHSGEIRYESARAKFLGRGHTARDPVAFEKGGNWLSGEMGATLDPIMALGLEIELAPHESRQLAYLTIASESLPDALVIAQRYRNWPEIDRAFDQARGQAETEMRQLGLTSSDLEKIQQLLSLLWMPHAALRPRPEILLANHEGQSGLWAYSISGDYPILLVQIENEEDSALLGEVLRAHIYWRRRGLKIDLVILNERESGYAEDLGDHIHRLINRMNAANWINRRGGIFVLQAARMSEADIVLLKTVARVVLDAKQGHLSEQLSHLPQLPSYLPLLMPTLDETGVLDQTPPLERPGNLLFDNGYGGFSRDGREYQIFLRSGEWTPAPWSNIVANKNFGFLVTESGGGYTWATNSGENRLTPWTNDPVSDQTGEALYLRDEETAVVWTPTPLPAGAPAPYLIHYGAGFAIFKHNSYGLEQKLEIFSPVEEPVKIVQLTLRNTRDNVRRITATYYAEWVLDVDHESALQFIIPEFDAENQVMLARNPYNAEFGERVAFLAADRQIHNLTADRTEFLGRLGSRAHPAALKRIGLSGKMEAGLDPCAALQVHMDLPPGESTTIRFLIGEGKNHDEVIRIVNEFRDPAAAGSAWQGVTRFWDGLLEKIEVETPDVGMNLVLNRWLLYQALSCRIWGRSAFYQSSGAFGFRDQLQDVMSTVFAVPQIAREHILRCAAHQFEEGDVLHWWHPPTGRGVRTRISDDLLWLPFVTAYYVARTGDEDILDEKRPFLHAPLLKPEEEERYGLYPSTSESYSLYEHCKRAIQKGATHGPHHLPLIGAGDWNDGMNRVGIEGRGESIWLAWFLFSTLEEFAGICEGRGEKDLAETYRNWAQEYKDALEEHAWDGNWYLRAYYDDGAPLGGSENLECKIDSIAQSWSILSAAGDPTRAARAMRSVEDHLILEEDRLMLLFTPPFDKTPRDPGYIRGYLPGVRENGGQYTHASIWSVWAYCRMGEGDRAWNLFHLLNPIHHADTQEKIKQYKVEPYVIAADVYSLPQHLGRGGWTWYTGSSGWMYRLGIEAILGLHLEAGKLRIDPCIPGEWKGYRLIYRNGNTKFTIQVENPDGLNRGVSGVMVDGKNMPDGEIPLLDDGGEHSVRVIIGKI